MAMLSFFSSRPIASSFLLRPKRPPHRLLLPKALASASSLTPPTLRGDPTTAPDTDPTPLFLRPATHPAPTSALVEFRRRASALVPPSAPHLHRHLRWLLADACAADPAPDPGAALLRAPLDDLEALWLGHVRGRRPFQYVVGNEHWRDLVVAVREGVLIPRPETEAVVDMVRRVDGFAAGWWADLGTGSGAIALAVARELGPAGRVFATDVSDVAIEVARLNVERYGVQVSTTDDRVHLSKFI
jgi:release factor glutamine methyltransferase